MPLLNLQNNLSIASEDASITGHSNSSNLVPERIDLSGIDLSGTGGVVPDVVIDNIYNSNKIAEWTYAYEKTILGVDVSQVGDVITITFNFLDGSSLSDSFTVTGDKTYVHTQDIASNSWVITHNLAKFANVTIVDSSNNVVDAEIVYNTENQLTINFVIPFVGKAYIN